MASIVDKLLAARRLDLHDNERDISKCCERLVRLVAEREQIMDDIDNLERRKE